MYNVYLISCGDGSNKKYKIGYTKNSVASRLKQLKTGNSSDLIIEKVHTSKWGTKIEAILHRKYSTQRISGEWFDLELFQVADFLKDCQNLDEYFEMFITQSTFKNPKTFLV